MLLNFSNFCRNLLDFKQEFIFSFICHCTIQKALFLPGGLETPFLPPFPFGASVFLDEIIVDLKKLSSLL